MKSQIIRRVVCQRLQRQWAIVPWLGMLIVMPGQAQQVTPTGDNGRLTPPSDCTVSPDPLPLTCGTIVNFPPQTATTLSTTDYILVGAGAGDGTTAGTGTLTLNGVTNGSLGGLLVGLAAGSDGTVTLTNASTLNGGAQAHIGGRGQALLDIQGGSVFSANTVTIGRGNGSVGRVHVSGTGSQLNILNTGTIDPGTLYVGRDGSGQLIVENGATASVPNYIYAGRSAGSTGEIIVRGANSTLTAGQTVYIGYEGTGSLLVQNGAATTATTLVLGSRAGGSGSLTVDGVNGGTASRLTLSGVLRIGDAGDGTGHITNGGSVQADKTWVGSGTTGSGTLTIDGTGSSLSSTTNLYVGSVNQGALTVRNGGTLTTPGTSYIGFDRGSTGTLTVTGSGTTWTGRLLDVGESGTGTLNVLNGGQVTLGGIRPRLIVGALAGGTGAITVSGTGSTLTAPLGTDTVAGDFIVGELGNGSLTVDSGGTVNAYWLGVGRGASGTLVLRGTGTTVNTTYNANGSLVVGNQARGTISVEDGAVLNVAGFAHLGGAARFTAPNSGGQTIVTVTGTGSTFNAATLYVGEYNRAELNVLNGGKVVVSGPTSLGVTYTSSGSSTGDGTVTVSGAGSQLTTSNILVGNSYAGSLSITNGGVVTATTGSVVIGYGTTATGNALIDGTGSRLTVGTFLNVGSAGSGNLAVRNGGTLQTGTSSSVVGLSSGSSGTLSLSGSGSTWTATGLIEVGRSGTGLLSISDGAVVTANASGTALLSASTSTSTARVLISNGGRLTLASSLRVGDSGTASFDVVDGGTVQAGSASYIGYLASGSGTLTLRGTGSAAAFNAASGVGLTLGASGTGTMNVLAGATVTVPTSSLWVGSGTTGNGALMISDPGSSVTVSGASSLVNIGSSATGVVTVANGGTLAAQLQISTGAGTGNGTLNIGGAAGSPATAPGIVNTPLISMAAGTSIINFNHTSGAYTFAPAISKSTGTGTINQSGPGTTILTGASSAFGAGTVNVTNGRLVVNNVLGSTTSTVNVSNGAALGGAGTLAGTVNVAGGARISPGAGTGSAGTLTVRNLVLADTSILNFDLANPATIGGGVNDLLTVTGNLTLDGRLNVYSAGAFGAGTYRLINYSGTLTNNTLDLGSQPAGTTSTIQTSVANQVNLVTTQGNALAYWKTGGTQVWQGATGNLNWSDQTGTPTLAWTDNAFAVFQSAGSALTVDTTGGPINVTGLQFATDGYSLTGGALTLVAGMNTVRVGDGTAGGASYRATLYTPLTGTGGINKTDLGTLVLAGANTYTGGTTVSSGTLQLGDTTVEGTVVGDIANNATLAFGGAGTSTYANVISGNGAVVQRGTGTTILTGTNTYVGGTTIESGRLQLGNSSTAGSIIGNVSNAGTLAFSQATAMTFGGAISGAGNVIQDGTGVTTLTGSSTYTGNTRVAAGTLQIGDGTANGSISGGVTVDSGATLAFNRSDNVSYAGVITGAGRVTKVGTGELTFSGANTYTGGTQVNNGRLLLNGDQSGATGAITVASAAILGGTGTTAAAVNVSDGGIIAAGLTGVAGTLTTGALTLAPNAVLNYHFGEGHVTGSGVAGGTFNDLVHVNGNLTLDGTINVTRNGTFGLGVYRVFEYTGSLTNNGLVVGTAPTSTYYVQTSTPGQVNLVNIGTRTTQLWDATDARHNGIVNGGTGVWQAWAGNDNWSDGAGGLNAGYISAVAGAATTIITAFDGPAGTVTIDTSQGAVTTNNLDFRSDGYVIGGGPLTVVERTVSGTSSAGAVNVATGATATIQSDLIGTGGLTKTGNGTLILSGTGSYAMATAVNTGELVVNGNLSGLAATTSIATTGTLSGTGSINATSLGGTLAPGRDGAVGTFTTGNLSMLSTAKLSMDLGAAGTPGGALNDLLVVNGNLTLDGTLNVNVPTGGTFGVGVYRLINYTGTLTNNVINLGTMPTGATGFIQTSVANQVNLVNSGNLPVTFWDGPGAINDGTIGGGGGTWSPTNDNWTTADGTLNSGWQANGFAVFQGAPGIVNLSSAQTVGGLQFAVDGYQITGGTTLTLASSGSRIIRVGDGTDAGANYVATLRMGWGGSNSWTKTDLGTLIIATDISTSPTTIAEGTLQIGDGGTTGSIGGAITNNSRLAYNRSNSLVQSSVISGSGSVEQNGTGSLTLARANTYTGDTIINHGSVQTSIANALPSGTDVIMASGTTLNLGNYAQTIGSLSGAGNVTLGSATLTTGGNNTDSTFSGVISGTGDVTVAGTGTFTLTGTNTYSGTTNISSGTLQLGDGGTTGSLAGNVTNSGGTIAIARTGDVALSTIVGGTISGAGGLTYRGDGTLVVDTQQTYTGPTNIETGTLQAGLANALSPNTAVTVGPHGTFDLNDFAQIIGSLSGSGTVDLGNAVLTTGGDNTDTTYAGTIAGTGGLVFNGTGTLTLTGTNTYTGGTTIQQGSLQLGDGGETGSIVGPIQLVAADSALAINRSNPVVIEGLITGNGSVGVVGTGTLVLTAENTYTGGTNIASGATLQLGNGTTTGSIVGPVANEGTVAVDRSDNVNLSDVIAGSMTGTGGLTQQGSGTLTIDTQQTYTGPTTISSGTLQAGVANALSPQTSVVVAGGATFDLNDLPQTIGSLSGAGSVDLGTATLTTGGNNESSSFSGSLSGSGDLVKVGTGELILSGSSPNFTGEARSEGGGNITVGSSDALGTGTLVVSAPGASIGLSEGTNASNNVRVEADTGVSVDQGTATQAGVISGSGGIEKTGGGTLILAGDNTYSGGTTVTGGTLQIGNGMSGSIAGDIVNNGIVAIDRDTDLNLSDVVGGTISGPGGFVKLGNNTLTVDTPQTYTGTTDIGSGTLQAGIENALSPSSAVNVGASAIFDLNDFNQTIGGLSGAGNVSLGSATLTTGGTGHSTLSGIISGTGSLVQTGTGTLVLTGDNTYTGSTTVQADSTLQLGDGGTTGSIAGNLTADGTVVFNRVNDVTFAGLIGGSGTLRQSGTGMLSLSGDSSGFTGETWIEHGVLAVNGSLGGTVRTLTSGRLQGTGTVGNLIVEDGGTAAPGNSIGTLHVSGDVTFQAGSVYELEVNTAGQSDQITAQGRALVEGGTLRVLAAAGDYTPYTRYTIITANGGVSGDGFDLLDANFAFLTPVLEYGANDVTMILNRNGVEFGDISGTPNQFNTATAVESLGAGNALYDGVVELEESVARNAFDQLSGALHASLRTVALEDSRIVRNLANERTRAALGGPVTDSGAALAYQDDSEGGIWAHAVAVGSWGSFEDGDDNASKVDRDLSGILFGLDRRFGSAQLGVLAGFTTSDMDDQLRSSARNESYHFGIYGGTQLDAIGLRGGVTYSNAKIESHRNVSFGDFADRLNADYDGNVLQAFAEADYRAQLGRFSLEPFIGFTYAKADMDGFTEHGGPAALTVRGSDFDITYSSAGARGSTQLWSNEQAKRAITASASVAWRHVFSDDPPEITNSFGATTPFKVGGVPMAKDSAAVDVGLDASFGTDASAGIFYSGQLGSDVSDHGVSARFSWRF
ncbi:autotransporter-associated beta strand repeat-containing protein [Peristeroidobacter soli]|uniref:autotransporter-associated beta strand repeat-containing protein n=1 Tax=Peristeroidobacter soli TaxID=2497877 RepID=UPI00101B68E5|nr:autotransporter-associated beta strand repeat-containing protein [Peristeroidobacter soli]